MDFDLSADPSFDHSSRAALLVAAMRVGRSYQPNLLTRGTTDQAIITGVSAASGYGITVATHSLLGGIARRIGGGHATRAELLGVSAGGAVLGTGVALALPWREHEGRGRAFTRLAATTVGTASVAGLASAGLVVLGRAQHQRPIVFGAAAVVGVGSWLATRPHRQRPGSNYAPGKFMEDKVKEVSPAKSAGIGVAVAGITMALASGESALSRGVSRTTAFVMGGEPEEYRTAGRVGATLATYGLGWAAVTAVSTKLERGGEGIEPAHATPPAQSEITGSPASGIAWSELSREGRRWLSMALTPEGINAVMNRTDAVQPIRVYASLQAAPDPVDRARLLLAEIDRTKALERPVFVLFSPTGSGYVNYAANETLEYLTGGNCASAAIQYSVLPSSLSLTKVGTGVEQTRMVLDGINARLRDMPPERRPRFLLFGESLGSQVSEEVFRGTGLFGLEASGIERALWIGTPNATEWRQEIWGDRSVSVPPEVGPGPVYLPRSLIDLFQMPESERAKVRYLLLENGDDPIPKFGSPLVLNRPAWLGPDEKRPPGSPRGTSWMPVTTFFATFLDMMNALTPTPGVFAQGGHDYRLVLPFAIREFWDLPADDEQMSRMLWALRLRERAWELNRRWSAAGTLTGDDHAKANAKVLEDLAAWQGSGPVTAADVEHLLTSGLQPAPAPGPLPDLLEPTPAPTGAPANIVAALQAPVAQAVTPG
ncbi:MAG: hypothetical protein QG597_2230 [Actinomycetota bacterium]|nr:hypothetical protein [Actinomycetota bacterium]